MSPPVTVKSLVPLLGMHRSGATAVTKSLQVLGMGLEDRSERSDPGRSRGFWADRDCTDINEKLLSFMGVHHPLDLAWDPLRADSRVDKLKMQAIDLVSGRLIDHEGLWGFADPRTCRLLGFWTDVLSVVDAEVTFVIAARNPASVAASLFVRYGVGTEKAYLLWLQHVLPSLTFTRTARRIVVDYDDLLAAPYSQLVRLSDKLTLSLPRAGDVEPNFLERGRRHAQSTETELDRDSRAWPLVTSAYRLLRLLAADKESQAESSIQDTLDGLNEEFNVILAAYGCIKSFEDGQASVDDLLNHDLGPWQAAMGRRKTNADFEPMLAGSDDPIAHLNQVVAERDDRIANLDASMTERNDRIANLEASLTDRDRRLAGLEQLLVRRNREATTLLGSTSWRITKSWRSVSRFIRASGKRLNLSGTADLGPDELPDGFDRDAYLILNPDVAASAVDPSAHYLRYGYQEGRRFSLPEVVPPAKASGSNAVDRSQFLPDGFDGAVYLGLNPDVAASGIDPATHYLNHGRSEGRRFSPPDIPPAKDSGSNRVDPSQLPKRFDGAVYLKLNPDVAASGFDAATHYLSYGRWERRSYAYRDIEPEGMRHVRGNRESILVVGHEASLTGAPVLSLNLVHKLVGRYNVVVLLLGGGPLVDSFVQAGAVTLVSSILRGNAHLADYVVGRLHERFNFRFALVNSIESRAVLPALAVRFVPAVSLIHEFAAYTRPPDAFKGALFWSSDVVFSANVTLQNALHDAPDLEERSVHIVPQGRCLVPMEQVTDEQLERESERLRRLIRPAGSNDDLVVVLGAGSVQLRKGVELFIEIAARVVSVPGGRGCRFFWFGSGYDPDHDTGYSIYLADQIQRAGLEKHVIFAGATLAIETAYEEADLFLLSSRLDPLPNVAIDALAYGMPLLCFDRATGIADFLKTVGLGHRCVARYLDTAEMADKIVALAGSQRLRHEVGERGREAAASFFSMRSYVSSLEALAQRASDGVQQEKEDVEVILGSGLFRRDFSVRPTATQPALDYAVRLFVRGWAVGIDRRKPFPGFHPGIYLEQHGVAVEGADPTADYIRAGQPEGPWNSTVIVVGGGAGKGDRPRNQRIALHLHVFYPELLPEITERLSCNEIRPELFVSVADERTGDLVTNHLKDYTGEIAAVQLVPNRGRDIGPFLTAFGRQILANYEYVGHIHTKKTADIKDASMGKAWYEFLLENLLGKESRPMADTILSAMSNDESIGMVFPDDPYVVGWTANRSFAEPLAARMGLAKLPQYFNFPVGTMFWAKTPALMPLINLNLQWDDYPEEPLPYDGTSIHAIERLLPLTLSLGRLRAAGTNVVGVTR
jgi:glycosyltransferase involved in cell wall biosynthesis